MLISASEFKSDIRKHVALAQTQEIYIERCGRKVARIIHAPPDKVALLESILFSKGPFSDGGSLIARVISAKMHGHTDAKVINELETLINDLISAERAGNPL